MELRHLRHEVDNLIGALTLVSAGVGVSFCTTSSRFTGACPKRSVAHYPMQPNQSVLVGIRKLHQQYFLTTSSTRGRAVVVLMTPGMGDRKMFSSDSSIQFGDPGER